MIRQVCQHEQQKDQRLCKRTRKNNIDILILKIDIPEIDKFLPDDIRFDILLYTDRADSFKSSKRAYSDSLKKVFSFMADKGIAIVNVDDSDLIKLLEGLKHRFITYGFNTKACVTTSSIGDTVYKEGFICCLQGLYPPGTESCRAAGIQGTPLKQAGLTATTCWRLQPLPLSTASTLISGQKQEGRSAVSGNNNLI